MATSADTTNDQTNPPKFSCPFQILNKYSSQLLSYRKRKETDLRYEINRNVVNRPVLSAESLLRFSRTKESHKICSCENMKGMGLALDLVAAAEMFSHGKFEDAKLLLRGCLEAALSSGTPVEKVVHHYAEALQEKIDIDMGKINLERRMLDTETMLDEPPSVPHELGFPFCRVCQYIGIQVILDNVESATKIHVVDFTIRSGSHWAILMRALADRTNCSLDLLKITAVGTSSDRLEEVGQWLSSHADSMKLPFSFKVVLSEIEDIRNEHFELDSDEVLAVYSSLRLSSLLARPHCLESFVSATKQLDPCLMVVAEVEADTNTSDFITRFTASLFLSSAMYDCIDSCLAQESQFVRVGEEDYFKEIIRNVVVGEGKQRIARNARVEFWRELFGRFGIVETGFSQSCFYQASLLASNGTYSSLKLDGKCIVLEWKGTPLFSLSAWKFNGDLS